MAHAPSGVISLWQGSIASIPSGWVLCDGNNGTPNMQDLFARGASVANPPGSTGGSSVHSHAFTSNGHRHINDIGGGIQPGGGRDVQTSEDTDSGNTNNGPNLPPFLSLAYIMKT